MRREELRTRLMPRAEIHLSDLIIDRLGEDGSIDRLEGLIALHGYRVTLSDEEEAAVQAVERVFSQAAYSPPAPEEIEVETGSRVDRNQILSLLIDRGVLVRLTPQILMHRDRVDAAWELARSAIEDQGQITLAEFRDRLDTSRKFAIALLEYFDRLKRTRLTGEARVFHS